MTHSAKNLNARMNSALKEHQKEYKHKCTQCFADGYFEGELYYYTKINDHLKKLGKEIQSYEKYLDFGDSMASSKLVAKTEELRALTGDANA